MNWVSAHRKWSAVILCVILVAGYWSYNKLTSTATEIRYVTATVTKGVITTSVSGSGQVAASNQVSLKAKSTGDVVYVGGIAGDKVTVGKLLIQLDTASALRTLRDAQASYDNAELSLQETLAPADKLTLTQAENSLTQAIISKNNAVEDLTKAYDDSFNSISNAFLDLPSIMTGLDGILYDKTLNNVSYNVNAYSDSVYRFDDKIYLYRDDVIVKYKTAKEAYDKNFIDYKSISRTSATGTVEDVLSETYNTAKLIADAIKSYNNLIDRYINLLTDQNMAISNISNTDKTSLSGYTGKINSHLSTLLSQISSIKNSKDSIESAIRTIDEKTQSLEKTKEGSTDLQIASSKLALQQKENSLLDAKQALADCYIRAPFDGKLASVDVKVGDSISSGTAVATFMTENQIAEISLNEVDVAKVKVGQKVNLTFDAVDNLNITGTVSEVDSIGTVSQGVVSYAVKISFDMQDSRVKPGMSVSASIITDVKTDVLTIPNGAIKTLNSASYVQMFATPLQNSETSTGVVSATLPENVSIETGISNDTSTEITSGLKEGDQIVVKTVTAAATKTTTTSAINLLGGGMGGGNRPATSRSAGTATQK
jgi:HlyD family secretion protein